MSRALSSYEAVAETVRNEAEARVACEALFKDEPTVVVHPLKQEMDLDLSRMVCVFHIVDATGRVVLRYEKDYYELAREAVCRL